MGLRSERYSSAVWGWFKRSYWLLSAVLFNGKRFGEVAMKILCFVFLSLMAIHGYAAVGANSVSGKITNITSTNDAILLRIGANEVPQNCTSGQVWMEIKQSKQAMVALSLASWTLGRAVVVYTAPTSSGYCQIVQLDPAEA